MAERRHRFALSTSPESYQHGGSPAECRLNDGRGERRHETDGGVQLAFDEVDLAIPTAPPRMPTMDDRVFRHRGPHLLHHEIFIAPVMDGCPIDVDDRTRKSYAALIWVKMRWPCDRHLRV